MPHLKSTELTAGWEKWTENLKNHRYNLTKYQEALQKAAEKQLHSVDLPQVDHYCNQFDIQLNNISQLKHEIQEFEKMVEWDTQNNDGKLTKVAHEKYENIEDHYVSLIHTIQELEIEFKTFLATYSI